MALVDAGTGHQVSNACLSIAEHDDGRITMDRRHGFGDMIYEILLPLRSDTGSLLGLHTGRGHQNTDIPRAMVEMYEDLCDTGRTLFPTMMPEEAHDIAMGGEGGIKLRLRRFCK